MCFKYTDQCCTCFIKELEHRCCMCFIKRELKYGICLCQYGFSKNNDDNDYRTFSTTFICSITKPSGSYSGGGVSDSIEAAVAALGGLAGC
jgi:hypothetical protein